MKSVLTIAGSDSGGAGGIQSDIKTITSHGLYATSAITSMTAQNTTGVYDILESTPKFLGRQIECVFEDIAPDAVKIGMISNDTLMQVIAEKLKKYGAKNIVLDTNIISGGGRRLVGNKAEMIILQELIPLARVILPGMAEAELLSGVKIDSIEDMGAAAGIISEKYGVRGIFFKDGHKITEKGDLLFDNGKLSWIEGTLSGEEKCMGKGCVLSASIACHLAAGESLTDGVTNAKKFMIQSVEHPIPLGKGRNPVDNIKNHLTIS